MPFVFQRILFPSAPDLYHQSSAMFAVLVPRIFAFLDGILLCKRFNVGSQIFSVLYCHLPLASFLDVLDRSLLTAFLPVFLDVIRLFHSRDISRPGHEFDGCNLRRMVTAFYFLYLVCVLHFPHCISSYLLMSLLNCP